MAQQGFACNLFFLVDLFYGFCMVLISFTGLYKWFHWVSKRFFEVDLSTFWNLMGFQWGSSLAVGFER